MGGGVSNEMAGDFLDIIVDTINFYFSIGYFKPSVWHSLGRKLRDRMNDDNDEFEQRKWNAQGF